MRGTARPTTKNFAPGAPQRRPYMYVPIFAHQDTIPQDEHDLSWLGCRCRPDIIGFYVRVLADGSVEYEL